MTHVLTTIMASQIVKRTVITKQGSNLTFPFFHDFLSDCNCDEEGSTSIVCDKNDGQCPCKEHVTNRRCDVCEATFKGFPNCIGWYDLLQPIILCKF